MNDPHVEALHYTIKHGDHVDYSKVAPLELMTQAFDVRVTATSALVSMKTHCQSVDGARNLAEPFLQSWELDMNLRYGPKSLAFAYSRPELIDRKPTPGVTVMHIEPMALVMTGGNILTCVGFANFPQPATTLKRDTTVDLMFARYALYREGGTILGDAANFCLTALLLAAEQEEHPLLSYRSKRRMRAAHLYSISEEVLKHVGSLTDNKGGPHARKAKGSSSEFTSRERQWLEEAMRTLIRRAVEVAYDPTTKRQHITMADLPSLA